MGRKINKVFVDLDNTLLPFDTVFPVWGAILRRGLRPKFLKITFKLGVQSIAKSLMVSCFAGIPIRQYRDLLYELANKFTQNIEPSVKNWAESLVADKSRIHIVTGSLLTLAEGISDDLHWGQSLGTEVETVDGRLTGKLHNPAIKGYQKVEAIKCLFKFEDGDFRFCAAAGDSYGDRYLLEKCSEYYLPRNSSRRLIKHFTSK